MQDATKGTDVDVAVVGDDHLRVDVLVHAFSAAGLTTAGIVVDSPIPALDAGTVLLDVAAPIDLDAAGVHGRRLVVLDDPELQRWGPSGDVERLDVAATLDHARAAVAPDGPRLPSTTTQTATPGASALDALTPRERQVLGELVGGDDNATIGSRLGISEHTVRTHVQNLLPKLGVSSRADAAVIAMDVDARMGTP